MKSSIHPFPTQLQTDLQNCIDNDTDGCSSCQELAQSHIHRYNIYSSLQFEYCPLFNPNFQIFDELSDHSSKVMKSELIPRSLDQVRQSYISKVSSYGGFQCNMKRTHKHLFVFDWDDTILCTSHLKKWNISELNEHYIPLFQSLDTNAQKILEAAAIEGEVIIITNAAKGWVQFSGKKYMPKTLTMMQKYKINIISARSEYKHINPDKIEEWKKNAFRSIHRSQHNHLLMNIICIGDSDWQMQAGKDLAKMYEKSLLKTVKFKQNPRGDELVKQQELFYSKFDSIVSAKKNLSIRLQKVNIAHKNN